MLETHLPIFSIYLVSFLWAVRCLRATAQAIPPIQVLILFTCQLGQGEPNTSSLLIFQLDHFDTSRILIHVPYQQPHEQTYRITKCYMCYSFRLFCSILFLYRHAYCVILGECSLGNIMTNYLSLTNVLFNYQYCFFFYLSTSAQTVFCDIASEASEARMIKRKTKGQQKIG